MKRQYRPLAKKFRDRLLKVAQALREAAPARRKDGKFTMEMFVNACGTPACALGHFAARPDLQRAFKFLPKEEMVVSADGSSDVFERAEEYFDLSFEESDELFGETGCGRAHTPIQAARYIEKFVAQRTPANG